VLSCRRWRR